MAKTSLIGLTLPATGTLSGQWGDTVNNAISQIVDVAVAGTQTITVDTDIDLAVTEGTYASTGLTANSSQYAVLLCTGARTALRFINTPKQSKTYVVINDTTGGFAVTVRGGPSTPTTGVTVAAGTRAIIAWNGSDFVNVGGGSAAGSNTQVQFNSSGAFGASANLTFDGTTLTANDIIDSSLTASKPVFTNGSKNLVSTGTLGVDQGGTGLSTATAYSVVFAGTTGTGAFQAAAGPGTATHVLTSNGAGALPTFQAPAASGVSQARATAIAMVFGF
jgi:hypothetical protein